jgi:hypothetical protein
MGPFRRSGLGKEAALCAGKIEVLFGLETPEKLQHGLSSFRRVVKSPPLPR